MTTKIKVRFMPISVNSFTNGLVHEVKQIQTISQQFILVIFSRLCSFADHKTRFASTCEKMKKVNSQDHRDAPFEL